MRLLTIMAVLAISTGALAQTPATRPTPPTPARPAVPAKPATPPTVIRVGGSERAPTNDEELALAALEGLMVQPADRALPIIRKVLAGSRSTLVKQRALFV